MSQFAENIEDLVDSPSKYGFCSVEEFTRKHYNKREQMMGRYDDQVAAIYQGDPMLGCLQRYYLENYRVDSLEQAERLAREMGKNLHRDYVVKPQLKHEPGVRQGFYNEVRFVAKATLESRRRW